MIGGVTVMDALDITLAVPGPHVLLYKSDQRLLVHARDIRHGWHVGGSQVMKDQISEVFRPIDVGVFANDLLVPDVASGQQFVVCNRLKEIGAGQMVAKLAITHDGS